MRLFIALLVTWALVSGCTQSQATPTSTITPTLSPTLALSPTVTAAPIPSPTATRAPTHAPVATATWASTPTATPTAHPTPTYTPTQAPPTPDPLFDQILERVSDIRGLKPIEAITPLFMTREELAVSLQEDLEEEREEVFKSQEVLKMLGLIPQDADLYQMLLDLYAEEVLGFYDTETRELYVVKDIEEITPLDEVTLAHEYVHALQQQHFDIHALMEGTEDDSEAGAALSALIEGDATAVQSAYLFTHLTPQERQEVFGSSADSPVFDASPYVLQQSLLFPYIQGANLVNALLLSGLWDAVSNAYRTPPLTTEQVLHPEKYLQGERPIAVTLPDVAGSLGQGWREVYGDVMGEFDLKTYLETRMGEDLAARAAAGWGGDRFTLVEGPQGEQALAVLLVWDSERDAREFFDALESSESVPEEGYLGLRGDRVLWVLSPSRALADEVRAQFPGF